MSEKKAPLTVKQEKFCQAYLKLGDKSAAYREAYNASNMKPESINRKAFEVFENVNIRSRIEFLQEEVKKRNDVTIDEIVQSLAGMMRFDIAELYDERGNLKAIHEIPKEARLMIHQLDSEELFDSYGKERTLIGHTKKIRTYSKLDAVEKLMKHLGGYEKDNNQQKAVNNITLNLGSGVKPVEGS